MFNNHINRGPVQSQRNKNQSQIQMSHRGEAKTMCRDRSMRRKRPEPEQDDDDCYLLNPRKKLHRCSVSKIASSDKTYDAIEECPTVYLTKEQMNEDPSQLLRELEEKYLDYGAVKIIACQSWNPPLTIRYFDKGITTRVQVLQQLKQGKAFEQKVQAYNLKTFEKYARNFEQKYVYRTRPLGKTATSKDQYEFWSLVAKPKYKDCRVEVQYAADLPAGKYGSGFPTTTQTGYRDSNFQYHTNLFNLNNTYKSSQSLLRICSLRNQKISGITVPWVYIGMKFSSFCWHVQDLYINSINYNHKGSAKVWYVIPSSDKQKFDSYVKSTNKQAAEKSHFLHSITFMVDPLELRAAGITVYKIRQTARSYVFTFPKVYHAGFSTGFNMGEAINYLSHRNFETMKQAYDQYEGCNGKKMAIFPFEWLIYENYQNRGKFTMSSQQSKAIQSQYKKLIKHQTQTIKKCLKTYQIDQYSLIPQKKLRYDKNMCTACKNYPYLSHLKCMDCEKIYCVKDGSCCSERFELVIREPTKEFEGVLGVLRGVRRVDGQEEEEEGKKKEEKEGREGREEERKKKEKKGD